MSPVFAARRRAEEFQAMVEGTSTDRLSDARLAEFLELVDGLRETVPITARPEFVAELRESLVDEARTAARTGQGAAVAARLTVTSSPTARRRERRLAAAVGGLAIVGATAGMSVAAQSALPGDPLYPLKRAIENAQTGVQVSEDAKGETLLANASGRLEEVDELSREGDDAQTISETLQTFTDQASEASGLILADHAQSGRTDSVQRLRDFAVDSMATITDLETLVPEDARASLIRAAQTLTQIDQEALLACPSCGPDLITQIPTFTNVSALENLLGAVNETVQTSPREPTGKGKGPKETGQEPVDPNEIPLVDPTEAITEPKGTPDKSPDKSPDLLGDLKDGLSGKNSDQGGDDDGGLLKDLTEGITGLTGSLLK